MSLDEIVNYIETVMEEKDTVREVALKSCRAIVRLSTTAVRRLHHGEGYDEFLIEARDEVQRLRGLLQEHPDIYNTGFVEHAFQEFCEANLAAVLLTALSQGKKPRRDSADPDGVPIPGPRDLQASAASYLMGMGDTVGELRRFALEALRKGDVDLAVRTLEVMEDLFEVLIRFNYPDALVSIKRKQDVARSLIEKTRGELAVAVRSKNLEDRLERLESKLGN